MGKIIWYYFIVFALSMLKFIGGPIAGASEGLSVFTTALFTILGASTSVIVFAFIGEKFRAFLDKKRKKKKKVFTKKKRKFIRVYQKFGMWGIAFLTPLFLTPIGGTIIALSFGISRRKIIARMIPMIVFWGVILSTVVVLFWKELAPYLKH